MLLNSTIVGPLSSFLQLLIPFAGTTLTPSTGFIPQPWSDELCYYDDDCDDVTDDFDKFEFD